MYLEISIWKEQSSIEMGENTIENPFCLIYYIINIYFQNIINK